MEAGYSSFKRFRYLFRCGATNRFRVLFVTFPGGVRL